jgi:hypothetical protein
LDRSKNLQTTVSRLDTLMTEEARNLVHPGKPKRSPASQSSEAGLSDDDSLDELIAKEKFRVRNWKSKDIQDKTFLFKSYSMNLSSLFLCFLFVRSKIL